MAKILLAESVRSQLVTEAETAAPSETGGILLGVHARSGVWVTHAVHLQGTSSHGRFQVPEGVTTSSVEHARATIDPRLGYAGEWHSHPAGDGPSATDRSTMRALSYWTRSRPGAASSCCSCDGLARRWPSMATGRGSRSCTALLC